MADEKKLIPITGLDQIGIVKDTPGHILSPNAFTDGKNVFFKNSSVHKREGTVKALDTITQISYIVTNANNGTGNQDGYFDFNEMPSLQPNDLFNITGVDPSDYNGTYTVASIDSTVNRVYVTTDISSVSAYVSGGQYAFTGAIDFFDYWPAPNNPQYIEIQKNSTTEPATPVFYSIPSSGVRYQIHFENFNVESISQANGATIIVDKDFSYIKVDDVFVIQGANPNDYDGSYTVASVSYSSSTDKTTFTVDENTSAISTIYTADSGIAFSNTFRMNSYDGITAQSFQSSFFAGGYSYIINDGYHTPHYLQAALGSYNVPTLRELPGWDFQREINNTHIGCKVIRGYKNVLIAGNLSEYAIDPSTNAVALSPTKSFPGTIRISESAVAGEIPTVWETGLTTDFADEFEISTTSAIQDIVPLQGAAMIYTTNSIHSLQFDSRGNASVQTVAEGYGALETGCVLEFDGKHIVVGSDDIYTFAGHPGSIQSICDGRIRDYFYKNLNPIPSNQDNIFLLRDQTKDEVHIYYPTKQSPDGFCNEYIAWNYRNNTWSINECDNLVSGVSAPVRGGGVAGGDIRLEGVTNTTASATQETQTLSVSLDSNFPSTGVQEVQTIDYSANEDSVSSTYSEEVLELTVDEDIIPWNEEQLNIVLDANFNSGSPSRNIGTQTNSTSGTGTYPNIGSTDLDLTVTSKNDCSNLSGDRVYITAGLETDTLPASYVGRTTETTHPGIGESTNFYACHFTIDGITYSRPALTQAQANIFGNMMLNEFEVLDSSYNLYYRDLSGYGTLPEGLIRATENPPGIGNTRLKFYMVLGTRVYSVYSSNGSSSNFESTTSSLSSPAFNGIDASLDRTIYSIDGSVSGSELDLVLQGTYPGSTGSDVTVGSYIVTSDTNVTLNNNTNEFRAFADSNTSRSWSMTGTVPSVTHASTTNADGTLAAGSGTTSPTNISGFTGFNLTKSEATAAAITTTGTGTKTQPGSDSTTARTAVVATTLFTPGITGVSFSPTPRIVTTPENSPTTTTVAGVTVATSIVSMGTVDAYWNPSNWTSAAHTGGSNPSAATGVYLILNNRYSSNSNYVSQQAVVKFTGNSNFLNSQVLTIKCFGYQSTSSSITISGAQSGNGTFTVNHNGSRSFVPGTGNVTLRINNANGPRRLVVYEIPQTAYLINDQTAGTGWSNNAATINFSTGAVSFPSQVKTTYTLTNGSSTTLSDVDLTVEGVSTNSSSMAPNDTLEIGFGDTGSARSWVVSPGVAAQFSLTGSGDSNFPTITNQSFPGNYSAQEAAEWLAGYITSFDNSLRVDVKGNNVVDDRTIRVYYGNDDVTTSANLAFSLTANSGSNVTSTNSTPSAYSSYPSVFKSYRIQANRINTDNSRSEVLDISRTMSASYTTPTQIGEYLRDGIIAAANASNNIDDENVWYDKNSGLKNGDYEIKIGTIDGDNYEFVITENTVLTDGNAGSTNGTLLINNGNTSENTETPDTATVKLPGGIVYATLKLGSNESIDDILTRIETLIQDDALDGYTASLNTSTHELVITSEYGGNITGTWLIEFTSGSNTGTLPSSLIATETIAGSNASFQATLRDPWLNQDDTFLVGGTTADEVAESIASRVNKYWANWNTSINSNVITITAKAAGWVNESKEANGATVNFYDDSFDSTAIFVKEIAYPSGTNGSDTNLTSGTFTVASQSSDIVSAQSIIGHPTINPTTLRLQIDYASGNDIDETITFGDSQSSTDMAIALEGRLNSAAVLGVEATRVNNVVTVKSTDYNVAVNSITLTLDDQSKHNRFEFTGNGSQTEFVGLDNLGNTLGYTSGFVQVKQNGSVVTSGITVTNGTSLVFSSPPANGDSIVLIAPAVNTTVSRINGNDLAGSSEAVSALEIDLKGFTDGDRPYATNEFNLSKFFPIVANSTDVVAEGFGFAFKADPPNSVNGIAYTSYVERIQLPVDNSVEYQKSISYVQLLVENGNVNVKVNGMDSPGKQDNLYSDHNTSVINSKEFDYASDYKLDFRVAGRVLNYKIEDAADYDVATADYKGWRVSGVGFKIEAAESRGKR
jgi:hypothetical protein